MSAGSSVPGQPRHDVVVVGAGAAGLRAASLLQDSGLDVLVLEAQGRIGGRIRTLDRLPHQQEAGAVNIGRGYARTLALAAAFGLETVPVAAWTHPMGLHIRNKTMSMKDWPTATINTLPDKEHDIPPSALLYHYISADNPLAFPGAPASAWTDKRYEELDVPLRQFLTERGASDKALELMTRGMPVDDLDHCSALYILRTYARLDAEAGPVRLLAGNSRLPEALESTLVHPVLTNHQAIDVRDSKEQGVEVRCAAGCVHRASRVVLTAPLPALRNIRFEPELSEPLKQAVHNTPYLALTKVHLRVDAAYWEKDKHEPALWTDGPLERMFLWQPPAKKSPGAAVLWLTGERAHNADPKSVRSALRRTRPALAAHSEIEEITSWADDPFAGGAWAYIAPGTAHRHFPAVLGPHGRVHFAGEHTAVESPNLEGAFESAERVAREVLCAYHHIR